MKHEGNDKRIRNNKNVPPKKREKKKEAESSFRDILAYFSLLYGASTHLFVIFGVCFTLFQMYNGAIYVLKVFVLRGRLALAREKVALGGLIIFVFEVVHMV